MKKLLSIVGLISLVGAGCVNNIETTTNTDEVGYSTRLAFVTDDEYGNQRALFVFTDPEISWSSIAPDNKRAVFADWKNIHYVLYSANLPDGSDLHVIAEQTIPEGHGELDPSSITWADDNITITYKEIGTMCGESGEPTALNPTTSCEGSLILTWSVDTTENKPLLIDKSQKLIDGTLKSLN